MGSDAYARTVAAHYERVWGAEGTPLGWSRGPRTDLPSAFAVLEFPPRPARTMWTYATVCMSLPTDERPIELHLFSPVQERRHVELLTAIAHYHRTEVRLDHGHTVNFGRPWLPGSACDHGLISRPYLDGPRLETFEFEGGVGGCYWLLPVTADEVAFKKANGLEALEAVFERESVDYRDPLRRSVV